MIVEALCENFSKLETYEGHKYNLANSNYVISNHSYEKKIVKLAILTLGGQQLMRRNRTKSSHLL